MLLAGLATLPLQLLQSHLERVPSSPVQFQLKCMTAYNKTVPKNINKNGSGLLPPSALANKSLLVGPKHIITGASECHHRHRI